MSIPVGKFVNIKTKGTGLGLTGQPWRKGKIIEHIYNDKKLIAYRVEVDVMTKTGRQNRRAIVGLDRVEERE